MPKYMLAANWKMNGDAQLLEEFAAQHWPQNALDVVFSLPATLLMPAKHAGLKILAGQDVSAYDSGAHTGEISAAMLKEAGCQYAIIGHSERRAEHGEKEAILIKKWRQLHNEGLSAIYCIGEHEDAHSAGETAQVLAAQLTPILEADLLNESSVLAYEPIWAIGSGNAATPTYAQQVHREIRSIVAKKSDKIASSLRILYGGSVKPENAASLIAADDIDGFLVGGASLKVQSFTGIIEAIL